LRHWFANQTKTRLLFLPRLDHVAPGLPLLLTVRWPGARVSPLNSQVAFPSQFSGIVFNIADFSKGFHGICLVLVSFPVRSSFCPAFRRLFFWPIRFSPQRQSLSSVLIHSSNHYLLGNCDSPRFETSLSYLTRFETVSASFLTASFLFRVTGSARTCQRNW